MYTYLVIGIIVAVITLALGLHLIFKKPNSTNNSTNNSTTSPNSNNNYPNIAQLVGSFGGTVSPFTNSEKFTGTTGCDEVIFKNKQNFIDNIYCAFRLFNKYIFNINLDTMTETDKNTINTKLINSLNSSNDQYNTISNIILTLDTLQTNIFHIDLVLNLNNDVYLIDFFTPSLLFMLKGILLDIPEAHYLNYDESSKIITFSLSSDNITNCFDFIAQSQEGMKMDMDVDLTNGKCYQIILSKIPDYFRKLIGENTKLGLIININKTLLQTIHDDLQSAYIDMIKDATLNSLGYYNNKTYINNKLKEKHDKLITMNIYKDITDNNIKTAIDNIYTLTLNF